MANPIKSRIVTADRVRDRLAHTTLRDDPTDVIELPGSRHWPASLRDQLSATLKPAGVLIPLFDRPQTGLSMLLTQRSAELRMHAGQVSFPGGRMEPEDSDIAQTALRETSEEVGLASEVINVVGYLPPMPTITGYAVTPVVGIVDDQASAVADRQEVEFVFEVPLDYLLDDGNRRVVERDVHGKVLPMIEFHFDGHRIWGATAMMIIEFIKIINK